MGNGDHILKTQRKMNVLSTKGFWIKCAQFICKLICCSLPLLQVQQVTPRNGKETLNLLLPPCGTQNCSLAETGPRMDALRSFMNQGARCLQWQSVWQHQHWLKERLFRVKGSKGSQDLHINFVYGSCCDEDNQSHQFNQQVAWKYFEGEDNF